MQAASSRLSLYLAVAYSLLAVYGSLHPLTGWGDTGVDPTAFLTARWPRYITVFDLAINVAAYLPMGFLWVPVLQPRLGRVGAVLVATVIGLSLSLAMETLQNYLPTRVPSNVDLGCNGIGAVLGALAGARWGHQLLDGGRLHALRTRRVLAGNLGDAGLLLLGLWLLTQLTPETLLFGNGDLRNLLDLPEPLPYTAGRFATMEACIVCAHTLAVATLATLLSRPAQHLPVLMLIVAALAVKTFVLALSLNTGHGLAWMTYGGVVGLGGGIGLWLVTRWLPARLQKAVAALALLLGTVLVNLAPENPYLANTWQTWNPGQFLNFHGLTKIISTLWPFMALPWLMMLRMEKL